MWGVRPLDNLNTETKYEYLSRPKKYPTIQFVEAGRACQASGGPESLLLPDTAYLGDFGMAQSWHCKIRSRCLGICSITPRKDFMM